jgi:hypothetical protein
MADTGPILTSIGQVHVDLADCDPSQHTQTIELSETHLETKTKAADSLVSVTSIYTLMYYSSLYFFRILSHNL